MVQSVSVLPTTALCILLQCADAPRLAGSAPKLSPQSRAVLDAARAVQQCYFTHVSELRTARFKIGTWDAGWWQIRSALAAVKPAMDKLKAKLLPQLQRYGFLS